MIAESYFLVVKMSLECNLNKDTDYHNLILVDYNRNLLCFCVVLIGYGDDPEKLCADLPSPQVALMITITLMMSADHFVATFIYLIPT